MASLPHRVSCTRMRADERYYEVLRPGGLAERLLIAARDCMFRDFLARMAPTPDSKILDAGVSDIVSDASNMLERSYKYQHNITACGVSDALDFRLAYPHATYRRIEASASLPFPDGAFDIAVSNAVLEHVGSFEKQRLFVSELSRVARRAFITVPNRYFPVEHHTLLPLVHYNDKIFGRACSLLGKSYWASDANLIFMTRKKLWRLSADLDRSVAVGYTGLSLGPFSSNLYLAIY